MTTDDTNVSTLRHFIDGECVAGESNRFGDVYNPATGKVRAQVPFATAGEVDKAVRAAKAAFPGWAATPALAARPHPVPLPRPRRSASRRACPHLLVRAREDPRRRPRLGDPRHRDRGVRLRDPPAPQGRAQRERREPRGQLQRAPAPGSMRRDHPVQFPRDGSDVDVSDSACVRQHLRAEAVGEGSVLWPAPRRGWRSRPGCRQAC